MGQSIGTRPALTVGQLIERLKSLDPDLPVMTYSSLDESGGMVRNVKLESPGREDSCYFKGDHPMQWTEISGYPVYSTAVCLEG